jgi:hypothetical protein
MKKVIVTMSLLVLSMSVFAGCDSKGKKCGQLFDKFASCAKEDKDSKSMFGSKDEFVKECKKEWKKMEGAVKCLDKKDCDEFGMCFLGAILGEAMKDADMKEEPKAEEPKAEEKKEEPKAEEPKAEEPKAEEPKEEEKKDE